MAEAEYLTVADIAAQLQVNEETVRRWIRTHELHAYNVGGRRGGWRVHPEELARFLAERKQ